jgi:hypothetical protein
MSRYAPEDLEPTERGTHLLLSAAPRQPVPLGFRDAVMRQITSGPRSAWESVLAAALALPSLIFLGHQLTTHGDEFTVALNNVVTAAGAESADAFFFVDGATVLALALLGVASILAAHASIVVAARGR